MARKKKDETSTETETKEAAGIGHNGGEMTEDQKRQKLFLLVRDDNALEVQVEEIREKRKEIRKTAKSLLGIHADDFKFIRRLQEDDESVIADHNRQLMIARWYEHPLYYQQELDFGKADGVDRRPAVEKAKALGKMAGLAGESASPPYDVSVPQHQAWMEGWHDGQAVKVMEGIKPLEDASKQEGLRLVKKGEQIGTAPSTAKLN